MKRLYFRALSVLAILASFLTHTVLLFAAAPVAPAPQTLDPPTNATNLYDFLLQVTDFAILLGTYVLVMMIIYTGFLFVTAGGESSKLSTARTSLVWTVIGGAVLLGAKALAFVIADTVKNL